MTKTTINLRIDETIKTDAENIAKELGLDLSSTMRVFLNQFILNGGFPFKVTIPSFNHDTLEAIKDKGDFINGENAQNFLDSLK